MAMFDPAAIILALIAATPGVLSLMTRKKAVQVRANDTAKRTTLDEYKSLFDEQRQQINECRNECNRLYAANRERDERIRTLEENVQGLTRSLEDERERRVFLEGVVRMRQGGERME